MRARTHAFTAVRARTLMVAGSSELGRTLETPIPKKSGLVRKNGIFSKVFIFQCFSARHGIAERCGRTIGAAADHQGQGEGRQVAPVESQGGLTIVSTTCIT